MIKLKDLLKESYAWERKFGEKLPTLASIQEKKKLKEVGAAAEYRKYTRDIERAYTKYTKSIEKLRKKLESKGMKKESKEVYKLFAKYGLGFQSWLRGFIDKLL